MSPARSTITFLAGLTLITCWVAWLVMLCVGTLAGLDVVNATVSFVDAIPLGLGITLAGILPLGGLLVVASESDPGPDATRPGPTPEPGSVAAKPCRRRR